MANGCLGLVASAETLRFEDHRDKMTFCGEHLVMLLRGQLFKLRLAVSEGRLAVADAERNRVSVYAFGDKRTRTETPVNAPTEIALDGSFLVAYDAVGQRLMKYRLDFGKE